MWEASNGMRHQRPSHTTLPWKCTDKSGFHSYLVLLENLYFYLPQLPLLFLDLVLPFQQGDGRGRLLTPLFQVQFWAHHFLCKLYCKLWIATGHKKTLKIYKTNNSLWTSTWDSLGYQYKSTLSKHQPDLKHPALCTRHHPAHLCIQFWTAECFPYMQFMACVSKVTT